MEEQKKKSWPKRHPILTGIIGLFVFFMIVGAIGGGNKNNQASNASASNQASPQPTQAAEKPMVVESVALVGEFDKNKLAAQDKYKGKLVQTTGYIKNISQDFTGQYFLAINPSNDQYYLGTSIQCFFKDKGSLTSLSNGQSVTVTGTMDDMSLGTVLMKDCSLVK